MKATLVPGLSGEKTHRVVSANLASYIRPEASPVLSTPSLLLLMEWASYVAIESHLDPGEGSVGYGFDFHHLAPTPVGETVVATARVTEVEGNLVHFEMEARDREAVIARGTHIRAVIDCDRFKKRLQNRGKNV